MRKTICVCVSGTNEECESKIIKGIFDNSLKNNVNVLVFSSLLNKYSATSLGVDYTNILKGESEIFNLINYDLIDGLIIVSENLVSENSVNKIIENCNKRKIPIINVNSFNKKIKYNIEVEGMSAFERLIEHLIIDHNCKKINFISGIPGNSISEKRANTYRKVLQNFKIPVDEKRIGYGYFWDRAIDVVKDFLKDNEMPDAFVCASDAMAIFVMDYLRNEGYKIPEDVIVTGYDGFSDGEKYAVPLTSVMHDFERAGEEALNSIIKLINGIEIKDKKIISSLLLLRKSCGCNECLENNSYYYEDNKINEMANTLTFTNNLSLMNRLVIASDDTKSLFNGLMKGLEVFNFTRIYLCINTDLEKNSFVLNEKKKNNGLSKKMKFVGSKGNGVKIGTIFDTKKMVPEEVLQLETPLFLSFTPLYFKEVFLGYIVFEPWKINGNGELFSLWSMSASNVIGSFYAKAELENMYLSDPLTGLYNRRGKEKYFEIAAKEIKSKNQNFVIVCSDIDNLKMINDKYGHEAGDIAITCISKVIKKSMPKDSICVRTGGDEFCILIRSDKKIKIEEIINHIDNMLIEYNSESNLPFKVNCSCGYYEGNGETMTSLTYAENYADQELYKEKNRKKNKI